MLLLASAYSLSRTLASIKLGTSEEVCSTAVQESLGMSAARQRANELVLLSLSLPPLVFFNAWCEHSYCLESVCPRDRCRQTYKRQLKH